MLRTRYPELLTRELLTRIEAVLSEFEYDVATVAFAYLEPDAPGGWRISGKPGGPVMDPGFAIIARSRRRFVAHTIHFKRIEEIDGMVDYIRTAIAQIRKHDDEFEKQDAIDA